MITNEQLNQYFVSSVMRAYFHKKLSSVPTAEVNIRIEELLKFLNMAIYSSGGIPFSTDIDEVWHLWILETQEYQKLCKKLCGGEFMHHSSNDFLEVAHPELENQPPDHKRSLEILLSYVHNYGEFEQSRLQYWPVAEMLSQQFNGSATQLNDWLRAQLNTNVESINSLARA